MNINSYSSTLLKAFDILNCFENDSQEIGIKEISQQVDMPQSSVYRIMQSLEFGGYIFQNRENKKYRLGSKFFSFSARGRYMDACAHTTVKYMEMLGQETGETVNLAVLDCDKIVYIHRIECQHILRPNFTLRAFYPAYKTSLGLVLMSELNEAGLQWVYDNNAKDINLSFSAFMSIITAVRQNGYAFDDQVFCSGLRCVAAPIRGVGGKAMFSMSISAPTLRMDDATYDNTRQLVVKYASLASKAIQEL